MCMWTECFCPGCQKNRSNHKICIGQGMNDYGTSFTCLCLRPPYSCLTKLYVPLYQYWTPNYNETHEQGTALWTSKRYIFIAVIFSSLYFLNRKCLVHLQCPCPVYVVTHILSEDDMSLSRQYLSPLGSLGAGTMPS